MHSFDFFLHSSITFFLFQTIVNSQTLEVSNILTPDSRQLFQKLGYQDETIDKFLQNPDKRILNKIQTTFDLLNAKALPSHRIQKWTILPQDFAVHSGDLSLYSVVFYYFMLPCMQQHNNTLPPSFETVRLLCLGLEQVLCLRLHFTSHSALIARRKNTIK